MSYGLFIKQFISFFVQPFGVIFTLFTLGMYFLYANKANKAKFFLSSAFFLLFLFSYPPFSNFLVQNLEDKYTKYDYKKDIKYIHVLGSGHHDDTSQPISSQLSKAGMKRVLEGVIIYKKTPNSKIIFTGARGRASISTAMMNASLAISLGVSENDIILDETAQDTMAEARFAKKIVLKEQFVLVTSATHMHRAMTLFKSQDLQPIAAPTDFQKRNFDGFFFAPSVDCLYKSQVAMHEYLGIIYTLLYL